MAHEWYRAVIEMFGQEDLMYLVCYVTGDTAELNHGLPEGTAVVIVQDYEHDDWFSPFDYYVRGTCCAKCDRLSLLPRLDVMPMLGVVTFDEWSRLAGSGQPLNVRFVSDNDLGGLGARRPRTVPEIEYDVADRVWRLGEDGTPDTSDTGTVTGEFENWDLEVIWDSDPGHAFAHPPQTLTLALPSPEIR